MLAAASITAPAPAAGREHGHPHAARETVSFDYGWRFFLGDPAAPQPPPQRLLNCSAATAAFPVNVSGKAFDGLNSNNATSAAACAAACCALNNDLATTRCWVWQWHAPGNASRRPNRCWVGTPKDVRKFTSDPTVLGFARPTLNASIPAVVPTNPSASRPDFDDSQWERIDTPHDCLIAGEYDPDIPPAGVNSAHIFTSLGPPGGIGQVRLADSKSTNDVLRNLNPNAHGSGLSGTKCRFLPQTLQHTI